MAFKVFQIQMEKDKDTKKSKKFGSLNEQNYLYTT